MKMSENSINFLIQESVSVENIVKKIFYTAWNASGGPQGMGVLQSRPSSSEEEVWNNIIKGADYAGSEDKRKESYSHPGYTDLYADYVFGKMMKLGILYRDDKKERSVKIERDNPTIDYQAWCRKYKTYDDLIETVLNNENIDYEKIVLSKA